MTGLEKVRDRLLAAEAAHTKSRTAVMPYTEGFVDGLLSGYHYALDLVGRALQEELVDVLELLELGGQ